jgi:glycosyltransferase involved in cell wall biosynthesis
MKVAIVYDRVNKWGGAESTLLSIHEMFPEAPLFTSVYNSETAPWAKVFPEVIPSFLQKIPFLNQRHELLGWLTPIAYELFNFDRYDLVISVTSEAAKGIITKPLTRHICYCLTPTRYLWSGYKEYLNNPGGIFTKIPFYKTVSIPLLSYTKKWDLIAAQRPDEYIAISSAVKDRIKKYYGRDSEVIFPPVDVEKFKIQKSKINIADQNIKVNNYYLIVSRLVPYKKVDLAVKTFNKLGLPLVVIGTGSEESKLKSMSKKNIKFLGFIENKDLNKYYRGAKAFIFPQEEDFGITAVEAQASGIPVIAYGKGGALDTVIDRKTGILFKEQTVESLIEGVKECDHLQFKKEDLLENAARFSKEKFKKEFLDFIKTKV